MVCGRIDVVGDIPRTRNTLTRTIWMANRIYRCIGNLAHDNKTPMPTYLGAGSFLENLPRDIKRCVLMKRSTILSQILGDYCSFVLTLPWTVDGYEPSYLDAFLDPLLTLLKTTEEIK